MTTLTGHELEALIGLQTSWGTLYSKELARLLDENSTIATATETLSSSVSEIGLQVQESARKAGELSDKRGRPTIVSANCRKRPAASAMLSN